MRTVAAAAMAAALTVASLTLSTYPASALPVRDQAAQLPAIPLPATAAAPMTPQQAVDEGAAEAAHADGVTTYAAVVDRRTGKVIAETENAETQVPSESLVKTLLAAYYLVKYNGNLPAQLSSDLHTMIVNSDDHLCSIYWTSAAVPSMAQRYDLDHIALAKDSERWGDTKVTAEGMALFLYRMNQDPVVGPWLTQAMSDSSDTGADGFNQNFGFNAQSGAASKQGWGNLNKRGERNDIHSIGLTKNYAAAVLETGPFGVYESMRPLATRTAALIAAATPPATAASKPAETSSALKPDPTSSSQAPTTPPTTSKTTSPTSARPGGASGSGSKQTWWVSALAF